MLMTSRKKRGKCFWMCVVMLLNMPTSRIAKSGGRKNKRKALTTTQTTKQTIKFPTNKNMKVAQMQK